MSYKESDVNNVNFTKDLRQHLKTKLFIEIKTITKSKYPKYIGSFNLTKNTSSHIKPGDKVICNVFDFIKPSANSWDFGARLFFQHQQYYKHAPIIGVILDVYPTYCYTEEKIDQFVENLDNMDLVTLSHSGSTNNLLYRYFTFISLANNNEIFDRFGVYLEAKVKINNVINYVNIYSFIKLDSHEGQFTEYKWSKMYELSEALNTATKKFNNELIKINEDLTTFYLK